LIKHTIRNKQKTAGNVKKKKKTKTLIKLTVTGHGYVIEEYAMPHTGVGDMR